MTKEQAKEILCNRCQHTPETEEAIRVLSEERPQGEWVFRSGVTCGGYYKCSNCGEVERAEKNYCPNCGADMRGEKK